MLGVLPESRDPALGRDERDADAGGLDAGAAGVNLARLELFGRGRRGSARQNDSDEQALPDHGSARVGAGAEAGARRRVSATFSTSPLVSSRATFPWMKPRAVTTSVCCPSGTSPTRNRPWAFVVTC